VLGQFRKIGESLRENQVDAVCSPRLAHETEAVLILVNSCKYFEYLLISLRSNFLRINAFTIEAFMEFRQGDIEASERSRRNLARFILGFRGFGLRPCLIY